MGISTDPTTPNEIQTSPASLKKILIVDDDPTLRGLIRSILEFGGYQCWEAPQGEAALEWLNTYQADVVIMDLDMPVLGGIEFLKRFSEKARPGVPGVLVASGTLDSTKKEKVLSLGARAILSKPFTLVELMAAVKLVAENMAVY